MKMTMATPLRAHDSLQADHSLCKSAFQARPRLSVLAVGAALLFRLWRWVARKRTAGI
jgi:hypothetical protein